MKIDVSAKDVENFDLAIAIACDKKSPEPIENTPDDPPAQGDHQVPDYFYRADGCLALSFDRQWNPFLLGSRGYNPEEIRWYIPQTVSWLLRRVERETRNERERLSERIPVVAFSFIRQVSCASQNRQENLSCLYGNFRGNHITFAIGTARTRKNPLVSGP